MSPRKKRPVCCECGEPATRSFPMMRTAFLEQSHYCIKHDPLCGAAYSRGYGEGWNAAFVEVQRVLMREDRKQTIGEERVQEIGARIIKRRKKALDKLA